VPHFPGARLIVPDVRVRESFLAAMAEFAAEHRTGDRSMVGGDLARHGERWHTDTGFAAYVAEVLAAERVPPRPGLVTQSTRWWVDGPDAAPQFIGRVSIRHRLTEQLRRLGGHIGYDVRRSRRRQGHATAMLRAALEVANGIGIDPALITCDTTNVASRRVIESNGGLLADQSGGTLRFWVPTHPDRR
jgi:predicted acetyltransferase